jgi:hypothetical protein
MNPFEFVLAIIGLSLLFKVVDVWVRQKNNPRRGEHAANTELQQRLDKVEERVRVLERIVTDERFDLKLQFKDLGS